MGLTWLRKIDREASGAHSRFSKRWLLEVPEPGQSGDRRQQMENERGHVAHATMKPRRSSAKLPMIESIRHVQTMARCRSLN